MIIVTGAAGFIGSVLLWRLNEDRREDLLVVDATGDHQKSRNLEGKKFRDYLDKDEFLKIVQADKLPTNDIEAIFHLGACSSTTETNEKYLTENNYAYSVELCRWAMKNDIRFIYASSAATYGNGEKGYDDDDVTLIPELKPLNLYGKSKQQFDMWVLENNLAKKVVGLKYFNVFGPNEYHKGHMRSVIARAYPDIIREKKIRLFKSYHPDYADGEQRRDFLYVKDAVEATYFFLKNKTIGGIYNIGTGCAHTWKELAAAIFKGLDLPVNIEYIEMPDEIKPNYQYFTEAAIGKLRKVGFDKPFYSLEKSVGEYLSFLGEKKIL